MEPSKRLASSVGFSLEFKREFIEKIVAMDRTLDDLAEDLGIPSEVMRKWTLMVERAETIASDPVPRLVPSSRVIELEHDLAELRRLVTHQAMTIQILEGRETAVGAQESSKV